MEYRIQQIQPYFDEQESRNLERAIETGWVTEGPFSQQFLASLKEFTGASYAVLANNGTLGLYLALLAIGINQGDEVIVPDFTFNASASSIAFAGGIPVFADINSGDLQINTDRIESLITPKTKAIMPVHIYGQACDMDPILALAKKHNLKIVEDAAQGFGVFYKGRHTGTMGDTGVISFFADKTITTGEGAVILTNDEKIYNRLRMLRNQGRPNSGTFVHPELGMNFRMTDLQCAVGVAQFNKFPVIKEIKLKNFNLYHHLLSDIPDIEFIQQNSYSNFIPFRVNVKVPKLEQLLEHLENNAIQTRRMFYPLHKQPCFSYLKNDDSEFPVSIDTYNRGLAFPVHCRLTGEDIEYICDQVKDFYKN